MHKQHITTSKRLIHNTLFNMVTLISNAVIAFFLISFFLGQLGEQRYGIWMLIASIFNYRTLLSMGLNSSINRYIPVYLVEGDDEGIQRVVSTALFFYLILAVMLVVASFLIYYNIGSWFVIDSDLVGTAGLLVLVVGLTFALALPLQLFSAVLSGLQRFDILNLSVLIPLFLRTVLLVTLLPLGFGLITMGLVFGISEIFTRVFLLIFTKKLLPQTLISFKNIDFKLLREMLVYGINTFLYTMGALIIYKASDLVIGVFFGTAEICQFTIAVAGILLLSQFVQAFTRAIKPAVSELGARNDKSRIMQIAFLTQKYSLLLIIPAGCFLIVMGREFLQIWVGEKVQDPSVINNMSVILAILSVGHCLRLAQHSNFLVLVGLGEHKVFGIFTALMALLCVLGSVILVKVYNLGLIGIAWSNFLPMALISGVVLPIYFNWKMRISTMENISKVWWPALLGSLPAIVMICVWKYLAPPNSFLQLAFVVVASAAVTLLSGWFLSMEDIERKMFFRIVVRKNNSGFNS